MDTPYDSADLHEVRPRWVWIGLLLLLAGLVVVSLGIMTTSWAVAVPGIIVVGAGALAALYGGLYYDVSGRATSDNPVQDVRENPVVERPGPEARVENARAEARSRLLDDRRRTFLARSMDEPVGPTAPLGAGLVLLVCVWIFLAQGALYPHTGTGQGHVVLDVVVAIVLALAALRLLLTGPRRWLAGLVALGGVALVLLGLLLGHDSRAVAVSEITCGVLVLVGAVMTLGHPAGSRSA